MAPYTKKKKGPTEQKEDKSNKNKPYSDKSQKPIDDEKSKRNNGIWDRMDKVLRK